MEVIVLNYASGTVTVFETRKRKLESIEKEIEGRGMKIKDTEYMVSKKIEIDYD